MACCGGVVGQVLNGATDTVNKVVNTALEHPLQTAALVAAAIYAPEILLSSGPESAGAEFGTDALWNAQAASDAGAAFAPASTTSSILNAGNSNLLGNFSVSSPNFETFGANDLLSSGIVSPTSLAPSMVDASGNIIAGSGAIGGATMAPSMADIMANTALPVGVIDMTAASGLDAAKLASAAAALKNANSLLNPSSSGGSGGGSSFAQPSGLSGGVSSKTIGTGSDQTPAYNENLKMMGGYTTPIQSVNTSGMVPSYKSMSSPTYARGGDVHGHPEYPRSPLETVFSTRGGSMYLMQTSFQPLEMDLTRQALKHLTR